MNASAPFTDVRIASSAAAARRPERRSRGVGWSLAALVSLGMWAGLAYLVVILVR
jgi:hypothetical protein